MDVYIALLTAEQHRPSGYPAPPKRLDTATPGRYAHSEHKIELTRVARPVSRVTAHDHAQRPRCGSPPLPRQWNRQPRPPGKSPRPHIPDCLPSAPTIPACSLGMRLKSLRVLVLSVVNRHYLPRRPRSNMRWIAASPRFLVLLSGMPSHIPTARRALPSRALTPRSTVAPQLHRRHILAGCAPATVSKNPG